MTLTTNFLPDPWARRDTRWEDQERERRTREQREQVEFLAQLADATIESAPAAAPVATRKPAGPAVLRARRNFISGTVAVDFDGKFPAALWTPEFAEFLVERGLRIAEEGA